MSIQTNEKMTQDEFASRLGVTPQAVSKWERGNGLPDVSLLGGICKILDISANTLLGLDEKIVENGNVIAETDIRNTMFAEPLVLEFGMDIVPCITMGLKTDYVNNKRKELIQRKLQATIRQGKTIRDFIHILEDMEEEMSY